MLRLHSISLTQFKNYQQQRFEFSKKVIGICGINGIGKSNLLDAIHYLCFTKSYLSSSDALCVHNGLSGFRLEADLQLNEAKMHVVAILRETGKKEFGMNDEWYGRMSRHIGRLPCVIIAPDDVELITGGSEERRRFMDAMISQLNSDYLQWLMEYNKLMQQRNGLLRQMAETGARSNEVLQIIDEQLCSRGQAIFEVRDSFLQTFLPLAANHYHAIAQKDEPLVLRYRSQLQQRTMRQLLEENLQKDLVLQRTTAGIHRDDLELLLNEQPFKQTASQGQRKSVLFALKLTEFETLQEHKGSAPLLLLDDVFEKLDAGRMENLLREVCIEKGGQVFITDTHRDRLEEHLSHIGADFEIIELENDNLR